MQRARNGRRRHGEHVHFLLELLQPFLVPHAKALLFVNDQQAQIRKFNVLRKKPVRADQNVYFALFDFFDDLFLLLSRAETTDHLDHDGKSGETTFEGFVMLESEHGCGRQHGDLSVVLHGFEGSAHGHLGFAISNISAKQAVHWHTGFHILLDVHYGRGLILGFVVVESVFKLALPLGIRRIAMALGDLTLCVELEQLVGHVAHGLLNARLGCERQSRPPSDRESQRGTPRPWTFVEAVAGLRLRNHRRDREHRTQRDLRRRPRHLRAGGP